MKVTYLHHSGFSVETETKVLLFDYYTESGRKAYFDPAAYPEKDIFVFVSHAHEDHYDRRILDWGTYPNVRYVLSFDVRTMMGFEGEVLHVQPHEEYGFDGIKADSPTLKSWKIDGDRFVLSFDNVESWYLYHPDWSTSSGFEVAGEDGNFVPAVIDNLLVKEQGVYKSKGVIEGKDLVVRAPGVAEPKKLRYLHSRPWYGALHNEADLPLGAFHVGE